MPSTRSSRSTASEEAAPPTRVTRSRSVKRGPEAEVVVAEPPAEDSSPALSIAPRRRVPAVASVVPVQQSAAAASSSSEPAPPTPTTSRRRSAAKAAPVEEEEGAPVKKTPSRGAAKKRAAPEEPPKAPEGKTAPLTKKPVAKKAGLMTAVEKATHKDPVPAAPKSAAALAAAAIIAAASTPAKKTAALQKGANKSVPTPAAPSSSSKKLAAAEETSKKRSACESSSGPAVELQAKRQRKLKGTSAAALPTALALAGVVIDDVPAAQLQSLELAQADLSIEQMGQPLRGLPVSGRICKEVHPARASASILKVSTLKKEWNVRKQERDELQAWKKSMKEMKAERIVQVQEERKRIQERRERREANEKRSSMVQRITNKNTIRKMSKKQMRQLLKN